MDSSESSHIVIVRVIRGTPYLGEGAKGSRTTGPRDSRGRGVKCKRTAVQKFRRAKAEWNEAVAILPSIISAQPY